MRLLPRRDGVLYRFVLRPVLYAVPFALIFSFLIGRGLTQLVDFYEVSLVFSFLIVLAIEANHHWVAPRIAPHDGGPRTGAPLAAEIASYAIASLLGSAAAALILHLTLVPGMLGSGRGIVQVILYSLVSAAVIMGYIYAAMFQRSYVDRIRTEAERRTREEQELKIAGEIQQALLPPRSRAGRTFVAAGASIPCRTIGGDFFDYFDLSDGRLAFALGDVAGKGPPAAILAAMVQGLFASHAGQGLGPAATMDRVNKALLRRMIESRFATIVYGVLGPDGALAACNAGHNPPFLFRKDGSVRRLETGGLMIGAFDFAAYEEERLTLDPAETLILYSDGVTDASSPTGEQFGEARLLGCLADANRESPEALLGRILHEVRTFAAGEPPADDVTVLVVRFGGDGRD
jgi:hypothetical protein